MNKKANYCTPLQSTGKAAKQEMAVLISAREI